MPSRVNLHGLPAKGSACFRNHKFKVEKHRKGKNIPQFKTFIYTRSEGQSWLEKYYQASYVMETWFCNCCRPLDLRNESDVSVIISEITASVCLK